ncbi:MAG: hypothetical protein ACOYOV_06455 [Bacteroidales bacterium]
MSRKHFNTTISYQFILLFCIGLMSFSVSGQIDNKNEVTVIAAYEPTISDAIKLNFNPSIRDSVFELPKFSYGIQSTQILTNFQIDPIKPAKIVGEPISKLYNYLVKAGFGTYTTPYFEFFANSARSKTFAIGMHAKHLSSTGSITEYGNSNYSDNEIELYGRSYFKKATLDAEVFFHRDVVHYYGFKTADFPNLNEEKTRQRYTLFGFNSKYSSNYLDSNAMNHQLSIGFSNLSDYYSSHENNIKLGINLDKTLKIFDFTEKQCLGMNSSLDYYNNGRNASASSNSMILSLKPFISTHFNEYSFSIGLNANIATTTGAASKIYLYPEIQASFAVIPKIIKVYAGITGGLSKNSFKSISDENPYINTNAPLGFANKQFEIYGGINTSLTKSIDLNASISNATTDNMPLFVNDTINAAHNTFIVAYDKVNLLKISASLLFKYDEKMNIALAGNLYRYSTNQEAEAWHKPGFDASLTIRYNIGNKIICRAEVYAFTKMYAKTFVNNIMQSETISGMADLNLGLEYRYSKILSGFINLNNLGAMRYQNWYNYPNQRFSLMAGLTYAL